MMKGAVIHVALCCVQDCNLSLPGSAQKNMYGFASQHSGVFAKLQVNDLTHLFM